MRPHRVLYVVTEPWYFANHRLDHARGLIEAGFEVHVATRAGERWDEIAGAGCTMHQVTMHRGGTRVSGWWREARALHRVVRSVQPSVVHAVALKPVALSLSLLPVPRRPSLILSVNGLGLTSLTRGFGLTAIQATLRTVSRLRGVYLLFQTASDRRALMGDRDVGVTIPGVGVDIAKFRPGTRTDSFPREVVYLGRAVASKGLPDLAEAVGPGVPNISVHLHLAADPSSPGALDDEQTRLLHDRLVVHAATSTPEAVLAGAHAAILPSRSGEGVSKFVLEALACGLPVLLSAQSGSVEVIEPGVTGLVFDAGNPASIRAALEELASWPAERYAAVSDACRHAAVENFSLEQLVPRVVALHHRACEANA